MTNTDYSSDPVKIQEPWRVNLGREPEAWQVPRPRSWWTGVAPQDLGCPGARGGHLQALPALNLATCSRDEAQAYFVNGWALTETLFAALVGEEAFYRPPVHGLRHPLIFYYAHPAVLYVNKLRLAGLLAEPLNAYFEAVFETGVDEMRWDDLSKNDMRWPAVSEVHAYRARVYRLVSQLIATHPDLAHRHPPIDREHPLWALFMSFEHERIHLETSSVLIRELPAALVARPSAFAPLHPSAKREQGSKPPQELQRAFAAAPDDEAFVEVAAGGVRYGKSSDVPYFGWDNEYGERQVSLRAFKIARDLVSNAAYWAFVVAGGYTDKSFWSDEGWSWRQFRNAKWPAFWVQDGPASSHLYQLRTLFEVVPMQWDYPAIINFHEAEAYARWRTQQAAPSKDRGGGAAVYRLMTEAEHHRVRDGAAWSSSEANVDLRYSSESPVGLHPETQVHDLFGNVWQWCADHFNPLPGFRLDRFYEDFSTPCFDGEHHMIIGGSFASTGHEAQAWARFHFRPHFTQHAGARLVLAEPGNDGAVVHLSRGRASPRPSRSLSYESEQMLNDYMLMHFGAAHDQMPYAFGPQGTERFPERCAELGLAWAAKLHLPLHKTLDIGCAVGAATFRLAAAVSDYALGIDLSEAFINAANELKSSGKRRYFQREEGELGVYRDAVVSAEAGARSRFQRGDASALPPDFVDFDLVLLANLICRIPAPRSCLARLGGERGVVRKGGLVVITCPFTWMQDYTPIEAWLGGKMEAGAERHSEAGLIAALGPEFELLERRDLPLIIREHKRKFQYIVPLAMVFRRRP